MERDFTDAMLHVIARTGLKKLPLLPSHRTKHPIANAAVATDEAADEVYRPQVI